MHDGILIGINTLIKDDPLLNSSFVLPPLSRPSN